MKIRELTQEQQERVAGLIQIAYEAISFPHSSGPTWTRYATDRAELVRDALWEANIILTGIHPTKKENK